MNTLSALYSYASHELKDIYDEREIRSLCRIIFEDIFHYTNIDIHLKKDEKIDHSFSDKFAMITDQLKQGLPIQYILGETEFAGLRLGLTAATLIPRPETEELVEWIAASGVKVGERVLDIGTGSGCIAIALAHRIRGLRVCGTDISPEAIRQAARNAEALQVEVDFREANILRYEEEEWPVFDVIVSNPPYIRQSEQQDMHDRVLKHEPWAALFVPDEDPLLFYRTIGRFGVRYLRPGGQLFFEINEAFGAEMVNLLESQGYAEVTLRQDIHGKDRMVRALRPAKNL